MGRLHDAELIKIHYEPDAKRVTLSFNIGSDEFEIIATKIRELRVAQTEPWGPSAYVNRAVVSRVTGPNLAALDVELQSGDVIRVVAERFEPPPESWPEVSDPSRLPLVPMNTDIPDKDPDRIEHQLM